MIKLEDIKRLCETNCIRNTKHSLLRLIQRGIDLDDVESILLQGEIIEQYPDDTPFASCLILGYTKGTRQPIHVVCSIGNNEIHIITAYIPDELKWDADFKIRR